MTITLDELGHLDHTDLATWVKPRAVDAGRGKMMVDAAVEAVREAVRPRTEVPGTARAVVLEAAARAYAPRVQQESLGARSVSYFPPSDLRSGIFLTVDELAQLGVSEPGSGVGVIWTRTRVGSVP